MIGNSVFLTIDVNRVLGNCIYAAVDGETASMAYLPCGIQTTLRGHVVALLTYLDREYSLCAPYGVELTQPQIEQWLPGACVKECLYEKSCGAVVFFHQYGQVYYLLVENRCHNWGFPKGHVEINETELDTARREILEETGLQAELLPGFRQSVHYYVREGVRKTAVYFIAQVFSDCVRVPEGEISSYVLLPSEQALQQLTYASERELMQNAQKSITQWIASGKQGA